MAWGEGSESSPPAAPTREGRVDDVTLTEIKITRSIDERGRQLFSVEMNRDFNFVEVLGLLEAAKWDIYQRIAEWG
jgi:hypothetical protein